MEITAIRLETLHLSPRSSGATRLSAFLASISSQLILAIIAGADEI
jgi:hypothetical protein